MIVSSILGGIDSLQGDDVIDATEGHQIIVGLVSNGACNGSGGQRCGFARLGYSVDGCCRLGQKIVLWGSNTTCCGNRHQPVAVCGKLVGVERDGFAAAAAADGVIGKPRACALMQRQ